MKERRRGERKNKEGRGEDKTRRGRKKAS